MGNAAAMQVVALFSAALSGGMVAVNGAGPAAIFSALAICLGGLAIFMARESGGGR